MGLRHLAEMPQPRGRCRSNRTGAQEIRAPQRTREPGEVPNARKGQIPRAMREHGWSVVVAGQLYGAAHRTERLDRKKFR